MRITLRLWVYIILIVSLVLGLVWLFLMLFFPASYVEEASEQLSSEAGAIAQILLDEFPDDLSDGARADLEAKCADSELYVSLLSPDGSELAQFGWGESWHPLTAAELAQALDGATVDKRVYRTGVGEATVHARSVLSHTGALAVLTVCAPLAPVRDMLDILGRQMIVIVILSLLVSMPVALFASRSFVRPIRRTKALAESIARGEYGHSVEIRDKSELGELTGTINNLSQQLRQVEEMRNSFIATVSHQFKTPLSIIQGHVELVADTLPPELLEKHADEFQHILDEIGKLDTMARDMLELARYQSRSVVPHPQPIHMEQFLTALGRRFSVLEKGVELAVSAEPHVVALADPDMISHVVENFVQNALRHSGGTRILLSAVAEDHCVRVCVADNGKGLTEQQRLRIWDKFYKADRSDRCGSGLGMSIAAEILAAHGAAYGVESNGGTSVWFTLTSL